MPRLSDDMKLLARAMERAFVEGMLEIPFRTANEAKAMRLKFYNLKRMADRREREEGWEEISRHASELEWSVQGAALMICRKDASPSMVALARAMGEQPGQAGIDAIEAH